MGSEKDCALYGRFETFNTRTKVRKVAMTCLAMEDSAFDEMSGKGKCGTLNCPFFKPSDLDPETVARIDTRKGVEFKPLSQEQLLIRSRPIWTNHIRKR